MAADPSQAQPAPSGSYRALTVVLRVFAAFAVITGLLDVVTGLRLLVSSGAHLPAAAVIDPVLNSHIKYMGAVWAGFGVALWWTTHDLGGQAAMLRILLGTVFLGGIGRLLSAVLFGAGPPMLIAFIVVELAGSVAVLAWHCRLLGTGERS